MLSRAGVLATVSLVCSFGLLLSACGSSGDRGTPMTVSRQQVALLNAARKAQARQRLEEAAAELVALTYRGGDLNAATDRYLDAVAEGRPRLGRRFVTDKSVVGTRRMAQLVAAFCEPCAARIRRHE